jgi:hypothetical protein
MMRQARFEGEAAWSDYPNVSLFEAVRQKAISTNAELPATVRVEVRCSDSDDIPNETYDVLVSKHASILNPRKGAPHD